MATIDSNARVSASEVKEIFDTDAADAVVHAFINAAHRSVENTIVDPLPASQQPDSDTLADLERFLSAHYMTSLEPTTAREKVDTTDTVFEGSDAVAANAPLSTTRYGRMVMTLDYTGRLASAHRGEATFYSAGAGNHSTNVFDDEDA